MLVEKSPPRRSPLAPYLYPRVRAFPIQSSQFAPHRRFGTALSKCHPSESMSCAESPPIGARVSSWLLWLHAQLELPWPAMQSSEKNSERGTEKPRGRQKPLTHTCAQSTMRKAALHSSALRNQWRRGYFSAELAQLRLAFANDTSMAGSFFALPVSQCFETERPRRNILHDGSRLPTRFPSRTGPNPSTHGNQGQSGQRANSLHSQ